jgi:hypothetical protein
VQDPNTRNTVESLNTQMEALTVPFPAEEVGTGATWETARDANLAGIETKVKMQFRLNSLDGDQYGLEVAQEVTAAPGPANVPGVPPGATVQVQDYLVKSTGTSEGTIASMLPARSYIAGAGDIRMQISSEGQTGNLVQHLEIEVSFESPT